MATPYPSGLSPPVVKMYMFSRTVIIEYSWSIQTGLSLYFDGNLVAETKTYISREVTVSQYAVGYIGVSIEINIFANIVIVM
jgi:hypothetical protein